MIYLGGFQSERLVRLGGVGDSIEKIFVNGGHEWDFRVTRDCFAATRQGLRFRLIQASANTEMRVARIVHLASFAHTFFGPISLFLQERPE
jgi:hypothetical protein